MVNRVNESLARFFLVLVIGSYGFQALASETIELWPLTLREGIEGLQRLEGEGDIFELPSYQSLEELAGNAGAVLQNRLEYTNVVSFSARTDKLFSLFFNRAASIGCPVDYLVQTVHLRKTYWKPGGKKHEKNLYRIEVFRLDAEGVMMGIDQHYRDYSLENNERRILDANFEIGCARLEKLPEDSSWPYEPGKVFKLIQDYSTDPHVLEKVKFEYSRKYRFSLDFDGLGINEVVWPEFMD